MKAHERAAMIKCNKCNTDKEETEFYNRSKICKECTKARQRNSGKLYYEANKDKVLARTNANYHANKEVHHNLVRKWRAENSERAKEISSNNYQDNKDLVLKRTNDYYHDNKSVYNEYKRKWRENNRDRASQTTKAYRAKNIERVRLNDIMHSSKRRALKTQCVPSWADLNAIRSIYAECQKVTMETGIEHHVDHIIPLKGRNVTGLHVESNLRIITKSENCRKSNKLIEEIV